MTQEIIHMPVALVNGYIKVSTFCVNKKPALK